MNNERYIQLLSKLFLFIILLTITACQENRKEEPLFTLLDPSETGIQFSNNVSYNEAFNPYTFRNFFNGAGVAIGDLNNDGLQDIFFCSNQESNKLYLNKGD